MLPSLCQPTASRSVLGEYVSLAGRAHAQRGGQPNLAWLEDWLALTPTGPLNKRPGFPDRELAVLVAGSA